MEEAEHALWRENGLSIFPAATTHGWPRVAASFDYKRPLRFEDEFEVHLRVEQVTTRSLRYACRVECRGEVVADGGMTIVCVERAADHTLRAVDSGTDCRLLPPPPKAPARQAPSHDPGRVDSRACGPGRAPGAAPAGPDRAPRLRQRVLHAQAGGRRRRRRGGGAPRRGRPAVHDEGGAGRRPGRPPALGQRAHRADRRPTRATTRRRRRPDVRCAGSTPTPAGSGPSTAGSRCSPRPASSPAIACCSRSRSGRSSASGPRSKPRARSARTACRAAA